MFVGVAEYSPDRTVVRCTVVAVWHRKRCCLLICWAVVVTTPVIACTQYHVTFTDVGTCIRIPLRDSLPLTALLLNFILLRIMLNILNLTLFLPGQATVTCETAHFPCDTFPIRRAVLLHLQYLHTWQRRVRTNRFYCVLSQRVF